MSRDFDDAFYRWFRDELMARLQRPRPRSQDETVVGVAPWGVLTGHGHEDLEDGRVRPQGHNADLLPRVGGRVTGRPLVEQPFGDQQKANTLLHERATRGEAVVGPLPAPWYPLPPLQYLIAVTRWTYKGLTRWVPAWPLVHDERGWMRPPVHVPEANDPEEPARVPNHQKFMPLSYLGYRAEMFESTRPRMIEYLQDRPIRALRHPYMAGIRDGRWFMRIIELPFWWVPEIRDEQVHTITSGPLEGHQFWYPRDPAIIGDAHYAVPVRPWLNDPAGILQLSNQYNLQVEGLNVPNSGLPNPVQTDFPRGRWDVPPNYGFLAYILNRPNFSEAVRSTYPNPVSWFGLGLSSQAYRVLEVYEDDGEVIDTGRLVTGWRITGNADRLQRTIATYSTGNRKRISHVLESEIGGHWRTATRWEHIVYDPEGEHAVGTTTLATNVDFTMAFLPADDGKPMQGRLDVPCHETVHRPFLDGMRLYEGPFGVLPAPESVGSGYFCGIFIRAEMNAVEVIRGRADFYCIHVDDEDLVTISRKPHEGGSWQIIWTANHAYFLPAVWRFGLDPNSPHIHHYRWMLPEWPTQVGQLWLRGTPFWVWERDSYHDQHWPNVGGAVQAPPSGQPLSPVICLPAGRALRLTGDGMPETAMGDEFPIEWY